MIKTTGIITELIPYSESSYIAKVITYDKAQISIIAKGWRKKNEPILRFFEYDFCLSEPKEEGLYILKELCVIKDFSSYPNSSTWAAAEAGMELINKIIIPLSEAKDYYTLLREYLGYLQKVSKNGILIFWRMLLRIFKMMGINFDPELCDRCQCLTSPVAMGHNGDLICQNCLQEMFDTHEYRTLSSTAQRVLTLLPQIGNYLETIKLDRAVTEELNNLFLDYYSSHNKQTLKLKSLSVLSQFY
nr:repair protein RecO [Candidatus Cloacimonadota bacterium]